MITEVAPGIYTVDHGVAEGKNAVICSERGAWAVDTGIDAAEGQAMADFIHAQGYTANRLIYTHGHGDHILGSKAFIQAEVYAHRLTPVEIERLLPTLATRAGTTVETLAAQIAWPTVTFSDELYLNLGNKHLRLFPTPGHSQDGISIYVEEDRLLIAGDSVVTGIVPAVGDGNSIVLEASLHKLAALAIDVLIPGHGPVVYGRAQVQDWLHWLQSYLRHVRTTVQLALDDGVGVEQIAAGIDYDRFVGDRLPKEKHKMVGRHRATVEKIVAEEVAQREIG